MLERKNESVVIGNIRGIPGRYHLLEDKTIYDDMLDVVVGKMKKGDTSFYEFKNGVSKFL